jgi:UDP-N-acetylglucosamine transferase subunit ALG13
MIFVTCGSSHFGFSRMMEALAALPPEDLYVQHGPAKPPPHTRAVDFLPFDDLMKNITAADLVISHAGVGSILCAMRAGHTPVIFPRLKRYHETVDDHQAELAEVLSGQGSAVVAWTAEDLLAAVAEAPPRGAGRAIHATSLIEAVRASILTGAMPEPQLQRPLASAALR